MVYTRRRLPRRKSPRDLSSPWAFDDDWSFVPKYLAGAAVVCSSALALQAAWTKISTPRLPPPPGSGYDFPEEGIVVNVSDDDEDDVDGGGGGLSTSCEEDGKGDGDIDGRHSSRSREGEDNSAPSCQSFRSSNVISNGLHHAHVGINSDEGLSGGGGGGDGNETTAAVSASDEFRLVLIGDSPVEGIGNERHVDSLGGRTARAFAKILRLRSSSGDDGGRQFRAVRYWAYGKGGLTARGVEERMVPLLRRTAAATAAGNHPPVHAVVVSCGVNDVLRPGATFDSFRYDVTSLLCSIRSAPGLEDVPVIFIGLPDFARLPFLPSFPLGFVLGQKGRALQQAMNEAIDNEDDDDYDDSIRENKGDEGTGTSSRRTIVVQIPEVEDIIGGIGFTYSDRADGKTEVCHPLLAHLKGAITEEDLGSLRVEDFLADDGFHPARYGTVYVGSLIAEAYADCWPDLYDADVD